MKVRHRARIVALQALYEIDCTEHEPTTVIKRHLETCNLPESGKRFASELAHGVWDHQGWIDTFIKRYAPEWPVDQIAIIDRNVLRIAIYEILVSHETPIKVAINEAVELAKQYGSDSSGRFVNGVMGTLVSEEAASIKR
jgi:N utilization substance protein B